MWIILVSCVSTHPFFLPCWLPFSFFSALSISVREQNQEENLGRLESNLVLVVTLKFRDLNMCDRSYGLEGQEVFGPCTALWVRVGSGDNSYLLRIQFCQPGSPLEHLLPLPLQALNLCCLWSAVPGDQFYLHRYYNEMHRYKDSLWAPQAHGVARW